jgi:hypothetical protein
MRLQVILNNWMRSMRYAVLTLGIILTSLLALTAQAAEAPSFTLILRDQRFEPAELQVPPDVKIELVVRNLSSRPAEFESNDLHREKIVSAGREVKLFIGPLRPGSYEFFDDFNPTTRGRIIAR